MFNSNLYNLLELLYDYLLNYEIFMLFYVIM